MVEDSEGLSEHSSLLNLRRLLPLRGIAFAGRVAAARLASYDLDTRPMSVDRPEWEHIQAVLMSCGGNVSAAARPLQRELATRPVRI